MQVEVKDISSVKKELKISIPEEIIKKKFENSYRLIGKTAKIKGFRPGRAPRHLLERSYKGTVIQELFKEIIDETYYRAISDHDILPVSPPTISPKELKEGEPFEYTATVETRPTLTDITYAGLKISKEKPFVTDDMVQKELEALREQQATITKINDPDKSVEKGDIVSIDFEGFGENGEPLPGGKVENRQIEVGAKQLLPHLDEELIGLKASDKKTIEVDFPKDYFRTELRGTRARFEVMVNEIRMKHLPELNDEFVKSLGEHESLDKLKAKTRENIMLFRERSINFKLKQDIATELVRINDFEVPECIVFEQKKRLLNDANMRLAGMGKENIEKYITENDDQFTRQAITNVKLFFLFEEIAKRKNIVITESDLSAEFEKIAIGSPQSTEQIRAYYKKQNLIEDIKYRIKEDKIYNLVIENSNIEEKSPTETSTEA